MSSPLPATTWADIRRFDDIPVVPFSELLDSTRGLSDHCGGPIYPDWKLQQRSRHCRRDGQPIDVEPKAPKLPMPRLDGDWTWMGPVCHHFGHQLADFSMRILPSLLAGHGQAWIAGVRDGTAGDMASAPAFFRDILSWFGVDTARVRLVNLPVRAERLWVAPQCETIFGPPPAEQWLNLLERHFRTRMAGTAPVPPARVVYVTRSAVVRGTIAGESALDEFLRNQGALVVRPEEHSLAKLLPLYEAAEHVVLSEGSAMHALQFMGRQLRHVTIIGRGQSHRYGANFLAARCQSLQHVEVGARGLSGRANGRFRETGLALLDGQELADKLSDRLGLKSSAWDEAAWRQAQADSVWRWVRDYLHARPHKTPLSPTIIASELDAAGLQPEPGLLALLQARERQDEADHTQAIGAFARAFAARPEPTTAALVLEEAADVSARRSQGQAASVPELELAAVMKAVDEGRFEGSARVWLARCRLAAPAEAMPLARRLTAWLTQEPLAAAQDDPRTWTLLSAEWQRLGNLPLALLLMQRADASGPLSDWMLKHWGQVARAAGETALAQASLDRLLRQNPP